MANHFARFGFEPRPWLEPELVKQRFLELSAATHPDKASVEEKSASEKNFQELNEAYQILRNTRSRVLHVLELSGEPKQEHVQNVPADALEFFAEVARVTKEADNLIKEKSLATSPMLQVQLMERALDQTSAIQSLQEKLRERVGAIEVRLRDGNRAWNQPADRAAIEMLRESAAALGFLDRWMAQLQERIGGLTF